jgi:Kef-type K+ transport system membrane component KefB
MGLDFDFDKLLKKEKEHTAIEIIGIIIGVIFGLALAFGLLCLEAWICMLLWNWFVVDMLGLTQLYMANIWHMWGVKILCNILFKSRNYNSSKKD